MITLLNKLDDEYIMQEKDILEMGASFIKSNNIEPWLKDIAFDPNIPHIGHYDVPNKRIVINEGKIVKQGYKMFDSLQEKYKIDERDYTYFLNFYYLWAIYHELIYVKERATFEMNMDKEDDIFVYLYRLCRDLHHEKLNYQETHEYYPTEIYARNNAYLAAYNIMKYTKLPGREAKVMYLQYLNSLMQNYDRTPKRVISPIEKLAKEHEKVDFYEIFDLLSQSKLPKIDRFNLGLIVSPKEYESIETTKQKQKIILR